MMQKMVFNLFAAVGLLLSPSLTQASVGPLCCGDFGVMIKGGVSPALYTDRGQVWLTNPLLTPPVFSVSETAKFNNQFNTPWTVGAEVAWNASQRVQFFLEYAYTQAKGKTYNFVAGIFNVSERNSDYKTNAGYLGARFYLDALRCFSCCGPIAPYIGFKAGIVWQQQVSYGLTLQGTFVQNSPYYLRQTAISGGLLVGLEWWFCKCWSLLLQGDFVATQGLRANPNVVFANTVTSQGLTNVNIGRLGWVVTFPVTLGLRWTF